VANGSYLALRQGIDSYRTVKGLDASGAIIFTKDAPEIAPGKE
jgi:hypothetical protein